MNGSDEPDSGPLQPAREQPFGAGEPPESADYATPAVNPYTTPIAPREPDGQGDAAGMPPATAAPPVPWRGGWAMMAVVIIFLGIVIVTSSMASRTGLAPLVLPVLSLVGIAVLVRILHTQVRVEWPLYLLVAGGFGVVAYLAFVPVCFVVGLPTLFLLGGVTSGDWAATTAISLTVIVCGLLFTLLLRVYLKSKYRSAYFQRQLHDPPAGPWKATSGDPYANRDPRTPSQ